MSSQRDPLNPGHFPNELCWTLDTRHPTSARYHRPSGSAPREYYCNLTWTSQSCAERRDPFLSGIEKCCRGVAKAWSPIECSLFFPWRSKKAEATCGEWFGMVPDGFCISVSRLGCQDILKNGQIGKYFANHAGYR